ncbi:integrase [Umezawaea beigongshangensis]|uniref:integrase n=1 Tax=Umezawaea beigongshangensis TaxID=2780383 RepID=UPI001E304CFC|nr:integrase [Umezawaea beigongshangensis]
MRLYESKAGLAGFTLCLLDFCTGARWGELVGQQRHEYDEIGRAIAIRKPLKEINGKVSKAGVLTAEVLDEVPVLTKRGTRRAKKTGRTKTPAGTRPVELPASIATFYEMLMRSHDNPFVLHSPEGHALRRSNFRQRFWREVWDGVSPDEPGARDHVPPILPTFTFHEGRHGHNAWMVEDGIPEVARRGRLGQKMKGIARTCDHVTPTMRADILRGMEARWQSSLSALAGEERHRLFEWFPHLREQFSHQGPAASPLRQQDSA